MKCRNNKEHKLLSQKGTRDHKVSSKDNLDLELYRQKVGNLEGTDLITDLELCRHMSTKAKQYDKGRVG